MGQFSQLQDRRDLLQRRWHRAIRGHARDTRPTGTELLGHPHTDQHARWHQQEFYLSERSTEHVNIEQTRTDRHPRLRHSRAASTGLRDSQSVPRDRRREPRLRWRRSSQLQCTANRRRQCHRPHGCQHAEYGDQFRGRDGGYSCTACYRPDFGLEPHRAIIQGISKSSQRWKRCQPRVSVLHPTRAWQLPLLLRIAERMCGGPAEDANGSEFQRLCLRVSECVLYRIAGYRDRRMPSRHCPRLPAVESAGRFESPLHDRYRRQGTDAHKILCCRGIRTEFRDHVLANSGHRDGTVPRWLS